MAENNLEAAIEDYTKAVELNNSSVHNRIQLGYVQYKLAVMQQSQEMLLKAEKTFKEIVNEFPKSGEAHNVYGQVSVLIVKVFCSGSFLKQTQIHLTCNSALTRFQMQ